jgi:two-component system, NtrC family, response regulator AtoC
MTFADASHYDLPPDAVVFGKTPRMLDVQKRIERLANTNMPVLISGPSGAGKEVISRLLHARSPWRDGPFVRINCPSVQAALLESELLGHECSAFTGAGPKMGRVEMANRGTLFLDEIGELGLPLQSKLLQLLQDGSFCRIGAQEDQKIEVRMVCATSRDLEVEVENGKFRQDLYYRINVLSVQLPPLGERRADIPQLVDYFLSSFCKAYRRTVRPLSPSMIRMLENYHWPGNLREMENLMKRYIIFGSEDIIAGALQPPVADPFEHPAVDRGVSLKDLTRQAVKRFETEVIVQTLRANCWSRKKTAEQLNISYRALLYKLKDAGISSREPRSTGVLAEAGVGHTDCQD